MKSPCPECGTPTPRVRNTHLRQCAQRPCSCGAEVGRYHHDDACDVARCAVTGEQRIYTCGASGGRAPGDCAHEPGTDCRTVWSGLWPGVAEAREYGWWVQVDVDPHRAPPVTYTPTDRPGPGVTEDLNRVHIECMWDRAAQRYVRSG